ncbi:MAG: FecR domain-containing protein, partial [Pseudomonadota bacterium]
MVAISQASGLPQGQTVRTLQPGEDQVSVQDAELMFRGDYSREGDDLVISLDGRSLVITEYFVSDNPPDLVAHNGAVLDASTVNSLAGSIAPGQYAQASGGGDLIEIGTVQTIEGVAYSTPINGIQAQLAEGDKVYQGDVIETGDDSKLGIAFVDKTVFSVSANARMVLNELIYDPNETENNSMVFNLVEGSFVFLTGEVAPTGNMEMKTPGGTMGIRGTLLISNVDGSTGVEEHSIGVEFDGTTGKAILTVAGIYYLISFAGNCQYRFAGSAIEFNTNGVLFYARRSVNIADEQGSTN